MLIRWCHEKVQHGGRNSTLNELRQRGYMVVNANSRVRHIISKCVTCRKLRGKVGSQVMSDLPGDRCNEAEPFVYSGLDMFGPFYIVERRKELKRYCALFTCLARRAVHLEVTNFIDADSFIMALRRFMGRRGEVREIRCDNGTNFVGASNELRRAIKEMDHEKIRLFLQRSNTDWKFNTPTASHMGGVWERLIRSCRSILSSLLNTYGHALNDESFRTIVVEVESIVNCRPLTVENISDVNSLCPLSPNHLLTTKSKIVMPPPGHFEEADVFSRRRWRCIQHIVNEFW